MRSSPILADANINNERHGELERLCGALHDSLHRLGHCLAVLLRHLKHELVVHLEYHTCLLHTSQQELLSVLLFKRTHM